LDNDESGVCLGLTCPSYIAGDEECTQGLKFNRRLLDLSPRPGSE
jgi:hypothetical protein